MIHLNKTSFDAINVMICYAFVYTWIMQCDAMSFKCMRCIDAKNTWLSYFLYTAFSCSFVYLSSILYWGSSHSNILFSSFHSKHQHIFGSKAFYSISLSSFQSWSFFGLQWLQLIHFRFFRNFSNFSTLFGFITSHSLPTFDPFLSFENFPQKIRIFYFYRHAFIMQIK